MVKVLVKTKIDRERKKLFFGNCMAQNVTYTRMEAPQPTCLAAEIRPSDHREFFL